MTNNLTLEKAVNIANNTEIITKQQSDLLIRASSTSRQILLKNVTNLLRNLVPLTNAAGVGLKASML